jgi:hypothetical protein
MTMTNAKPLFFALLWGLARRVCFIVGTALKGEGRCSASHNPKTRPIGLKLAMGLANVDDENPPDGLNTNRC